MKTLILTNSYDATTDLLVSHIGSEHVFRLNLDMWSEYSFHMTDGNVSITSKYHEISADTVSKVYWRKPFLVAPYTGSAEDSYITQEVKYIFRELYHFFRRRGKCILVNPDCASIGKPAQLECAARHFRVPPWTLLWNSPVPAGFSDVVAKSLTLAVDDIRPLLTRRINCDDIINNYPWFLQEFVRAPYDLTVVYIAERMFAYTLDRSLLRGIDWRESQLDKAQLPWTPLRLSEPLATRIIAFMRELNLPFGRIDFLADATSETFLEVNANGQWAWLDVNNENGLMAEMIEEVSPMTVRRTFAPP